LFLLPNLFSEILIFPLFFFFHLAHDLSIELRRDEMTNKQTRLDKMIPAGCPVEGETFVEILHNSDPKAYPFIVRTHYKVRGNDCIRNQGCWLLRDAVEYSDEQVSMLSQAAEDAAKAEELEPRA